MYLRILMVLALNAIPLWGFGGDGWSLGTILALYWCQTAIAIPLTAALIVAHRLATRKLGHYTVVVENGRPRYTRSDLLVNFLMISIVFSAAHALVLAAFLFGVWRNTDGAVVLADLAQGVKLTAAVLAVSFVVDLVQVRSQPFAWIRRRSESVMRRVVLVHLLIIFGAGIAAMVTNESAAFFGVFLVLKLLMDVFEETPEKLPGEAPRWIMWLARYRNQGDEIAAMYRDAAANQRAAMIEAEKTLDAN